MKPDRMHSMISFDRHGRGGGWRALPVALALVLSSGCMLGPNYVRPELQVPAEFRGPTVDASQAESLADIEWFTLFNDPELTELLREAVNQNLDLQTALARVDEARARARYQRSFLGPTVQGSLSTTPSPGLPGSNDSSYSLGLALSWELDFFGKLRRLSESARASLLSTEDGARATMSAVVVQVASTWFTLLEAEEQERIVEETIASQEESLALVRLLIKNGVASGAEEQQALSLLASTKAQLPVVRQQRVAVENTLSILLGRYPQSLQSRHARPPQGHLPAGPTPPPAGVPSILLERRPDVHQAEQQLHAATAQIGAAIANRFPVPSISLSGLFGRVSTDLGDLTSSDDSTKVVSWGPGVSLPLLDFGRGAANVGVARAQAAQAGFAYRSIVLQAMREVSDSLFANQHAAEAIVANEERVAAAEETLRLQRLRYRAGVVDYLDLLDSERQQLAARLDLSNARLNKANSYLNLYRALGGGWSDDALLQAHAGTGEEPRKE